MQPHVTSALTKEVDRFTALDNPIWHALTSRHASLAQAHGRARRFLSDVSPLSAVESANEDELVDMVPLVPRGESIALFTTRPLKIPAPWNVVKARFIDQMVCTRLSTQPSTSGARLLELGAPDVPEMLALTALTEPGPFLSATIRMGRYIGLRSDSGQLVAMAGQRLQLEGFTEISAVCTDPAHRGRGHSQFLVATLAAEALERGDVAFLHVKSENASANFVYEKLGFAVRRPIQYTVITPA